MLLQHPDGRLALDRGDVDAWAGLDPMMAAAEVESGAVLFYRKPEANTWGILNVREDFAKRYPDIVKRVLEVYEDARRWSLENPDELKKIFADFTKLPRAVVERQIERTELTHGAIGRAAARVDPRRRPRAPEAGVVPANVDVKAAVDALIDPQYLPKPTQLRRRIHGGRRSPRTPRRLAQTSQPSRGAVPPGCAPRIKWALGLAPAARPRDRLGGGGAPRVRLRAGSCRRRAASPRPSTRWPASGELWTHTLATLWRVAAGFALGAAAGIAGRRLLRHVCNSAPAPRSDVAGAARDPVARLGAAVHPVARHLRGIEGRSDRRRRLLSGLSRRRGRDPVGRPQARRGGPRLSAVPRALARRILLPAVLPETVMSLRSGLGLGFMFVVAAEFMGASEGLGYLLVDGQQLGKPDQILAAIIAFALIGQVCDALLVMATRPLTRWQDVARERL